MSENSVTARPKRKAAVNASEMTSYMYNIFGANGGTKHNAKLALPPSPAIKRLNGNYEDEGSSHEIPSTENEEFEHNVMTRVSIKGRSRTQSLDSLKSNNTKSKEAAISLINAVNQDRHDLLGPLLLKASTTIINEALALACALGNAKCARMILSNPKAMPDANEDAMLKKACEIGHLEIVKLLLEHPSVKPDTTENDSLQFACFNGHWEIVKMLLERNEVDPAVADNRPLHLACQGGHTDIVKLLLNDPRVNPASDENYALCSASEAGHLDICKLLLQDKRVDSSADGNYAIRFASFSGNKDVVKLLMSYPRVDPAAMNNLSIKNAAANGHDVVARLLLQDERVVSKSDMLNWIETSDLFR